mmetsp:Transcript_21076/g.33993  ORF Transcript_21076/g.33993 Transcript_21076/m.33993 type:complete len:746 (+) Transcript_21076:109-2346(+)
MPVAFKVTISNVRCFNLRHPSELKDVDSTVDAFVEFTWPGRGKTCVTPKKLNEKNPVYENWTKQFFYTTRFPEQLQARKLSVVVIDWNRWKSNTIMGRAEVDLATIATGPTSHYLSIRNNDGDLMGKIYFQVEMEELVRTMKLQLFDVELPAWVPNPTPGAKVYVEAYLAANPEAKAMTSLLPASSKPSWGTVKPLKVNTEVSDLLEYHFQFRVYFVVKNKNVPFLKGSCYYTDLLDTKGVPKKHAVPLKTTGGQEAGALNFVAKITNKPRFHQITNGNALHTDKGILFKGKLPSHRVFFMQPPSGILKEQPPKIGGVDCQQQTIQADEELKAEMYSESKDQDVPLFTPRASYFKPEDEMIPLPRFWTLRAEGRSRYKKYVKFTYRPTKQTTFQDPRGLPLGWSQCLTSKGELYWYQNSTGGTTRTDPRGMPKDWSLILHKKGNSFEKWFVYQNMIPTKVDPRGLPDIFSQHTTATGRVYFMDHQAQLTTWVDPRTLMQKEMISAMVENDVRKYMRVYWANASELIDLEKERQKEEEERLRKEQKIEAEHETAIQNCEKQFSTWVMTTSKTWKESAASFDKKQTEALETLQKEKMDLEEKLNKDLLAWEEEQLKKIEEEKVKRAAASQKVLEKLLEKQAKAKEELESKRKKWVEEFTAEKKGVLLKRHGEVEDEKKKIEASYIKELAIHRQAGEAASEHHVIGSVEGLADVKQDGSQPSVVQADVVTATVVGNDGSQVVDAVILP